MFTSENFSSNQFGRETYLFCYVYNLIGFETNCIAATKYLLSLSEAAELGSHTQYVFIVNHAKKTSRRMYTWKYQEGADVNENEKKGFSSFLYWHAMNSNCKISMF